MKTDTSEKGLEALIVGHMTAERGLDRWETRRTTTAAMRSILCSWRAFVAATQPPLVEAFDLDNDSPTRQKFLARLQGEITKRGVIDVLRHGVKHGPHSHRIVLRHADAGQHQGRRAIRGESLQRDAAVALQHSTRR